MKNDDELRLILGFSLASIFFLVFVAMPLMIWLG